MSSPGPTAFLRPPASPPGRLVLERRGTDYSVSTSDDDTPTPYHVTPILEPIRLLGESAAPNPVHATPAPDLSSRPESGWAAVARSIRDVDEQKIKDVKEDIDNILVFAGLYSAVLSALIAISILSLQPDSSGTIIVLLTQLVAQTHSYTITPGSLNSTTPPIDATAIANAPFEPLLAAKRVNVLWFASLTLSLLSASFSILVKQWLREYLAGEYVSPQARLRIRYFRKPGLKQWHVFGIASLLPVVLQLALALFFVGLCFFTLDIHTSIGYTTIPLVAGWALLLVATAFAPSVSPQCSYKIPLLRPITQALRSFMFKSLKFLKELSNLPAESSHVAHPMDAWLALDCTEEVVAQDKRFDIEILSEIDRTQGDDQLLLKMCRAVRETLSPEKSFEFVVKILAARLPSVNFSAGRFPMMLDFTKLPSRTCTILLDANADALYQELSQFPPSQVIQWSCWSWNSLMLLFAQLPCTLSERAMATISLCFTATSHTRVNNIFTAMLKDCAGTSDEQDELILYLLKRLRPTFNRTRISHVLASLLRLFAIRFCPENGRRCRSLPECFATHDIPDGLVRQICDLLTSRMLDDVNGDVAWSGRHDDIIQFLCKYRYKIKEDEREWDHNIELRILASAILQRQEIMPRFGRFLYDPMRLDPNCMHIYHTTFAYSTNSDIILTNLHDAFHNYIAGIKQTPEQVDAAFRAAILEFLHRQILSMQEIVKDVLPATVTVTLLPIWRSILRTVHVVLKDFDSSHGHLAVGQDAAICVQNILEEIDTLDDAWFCARHEDSPHYTNPKINFEQWAITFHPRTEFVSDNLIMDLARLLPPLHKGRSSQRVRRIEYLNVKNSPSGRSLPALPETGGMADIGRGGEFDTSSPTHAIPSNEHITRAIDTASRVNRTAEVLLGSVAETEQDDVGVYEENTAQDDTIQFEGISDQLPTPLSMNVVSQQSVHTPLDVRRWVERGDR